MESARQILDAIRDGNLDALKRFTSQGVHARIQGEELRQSGDNGHMELLDWFIGGESDEHNTVRKHCRFLACLYGHLDVVRFLMETIDVTARDDTESMIICAATSGHFDVVQWLAERGADVTACENEANIEAAGGENN